MNESNNLLIYKNDNGDVIVDAIYKDETLWLHKKEWQKRKRNFKYIEKEK